MTLTEKRERRVLWVSFGAGLLFAAAEFIFSIFSGSQSALMDAVYDASELIFIVFILILIPLFHRPISEQHPYGFTQLESLILIIKSVMMLSVTFGLSADIIRNALSGGNAVDTRQVALFQAVLGLGSVVIYGTMRRMNRVLSSPLVDAELLGWKVDTFYSFGMSLAFFASSLLEGTALDFLLPYFDPVMAVAISLLTLPEIVRSLRETLRGLFLFSPDDETRETVKNLSGQVLAPYGFTPVFFDIIRTGRVLWISVYVTLQGPILRMEDLRSASGELKQVLGTEFENCACELIVSPDDHPSASLTPPQNNGGD